MEIRIPVGANPQHLLEVRRLALRLMAEHDLRPGEPGGWSLKFDHASKRAGVTYRDSKTISLSMKIMAQWPLRECEDTILHEIAHALTTGGHDREWRKVCMQIGAKPNTYYPDSLRPPSKYVGTCPQGHTFRRERWPKRDLACAICSPRFSQKNLITWKVR